MSRCGAFPDPAQVPAEFGPRLPACVREPGHRPPHRAHVGPIQRDDGLSTVLEWEDPAHFVGVLRDLEARYGREAIRMWVERAPEHGDLRMPTNVSPPWLVPPDWGRLAQPVVVSSMDEFQRVYGSEKTPAELYAELAARLGEDDADDDDGWEPVDDGGPTLTVDKYGGTYSFTRAPIPAGWRGWPVRARMALRRYVLEPVDDMAMATGGTVARVWWPVEARLERAVVWVRAWWRGEA